MQPLWGQIMGAMASVALLSQQCMFLESVFAGLTSPLSEYVEHEYAIRYVQL